MLSTMSKKLKKKSIHIEGEEKKIYKKISAKIIFLSPTYI